MNLRELFEHRSGRVIAAFRAVLALFFLVAVLIEPVDRADDLHLGKELLGAYLLLSLGLVVLAWRSWWYDQRLAAAMLATDVAVFLAAVYLTESSDTDFSSPFLSLFALIVLSATLRWDWRAAARTGVVVTLLFVIAGFTIAFTHFPLDVFRFGRRTFYMVALLLVLVWFGIQRREPSVPALDALPDAGGDAGRWAALEFAMGVLGAPQGILAWSDAEEPWIELRRIGPAGRTEDRAAPDALAGWDAANREVRLFDLARRRKLVRDAGDWPRALPLASPVPLGPVIGIDEGLSVPFQSVSGQGLLIFGGIGGLGPDYVTLGQVLARELSAAFDREAVARFEREALVARTRSAIARDLHDSVSQSLAGACFRLEALRRSLHDGLINDRAAAEDEIVNVRDALRREQSHVRGLIETLRTRAQQPHWHDLGADLDATLADAAAHWGVAANLVAPTSAHVPGWLSHEIQQLVREAVANAARHGEARTVTVELGGGANPSRIGLAIVDDGSGFDAAVQASRPWSISERVTALGGELDVASSSAGTRLVISLPASAATGTPA